MITFIPVDPKTGADADTHAQTLPIVAWLIEGEGWNEIMGIPILPLNITELDSLFIPQC